MSAVCGVRRWASLSACFWVVCGFVGAPLAPRRFRFRRAVWACVLGPGLGCAQPFLAGLSGCVFCAFFFLFFFFLSRVLWSLSLHPLSFGLGWWLSFFFFFFSLSLFPVGRCYWLGVAGFGWVVPLCLCGGPVFGAFWGGAWPPVVVLAGGLAAVGCFRAFSPSPLLFFLGGGGGLPVPPSAFPRLAHALACIQCCLPGCCLQLRSVWPRSGPMGRVGYVHGGLSAPSCRVRSWLCRLGGCARRMLVVLG